MKAVILYTIEADKGKCDRIATKEPDWEVVTHHVSFEKEDSLCKPDTESKPSPVYLRLSRETLVFIATQATSKVDCFVWLGHARPGALSAADSSFALKEKQPSYISLSDVLQCIYQLDPTIVNFHACNFGQLAGKRSDPAHEDQHGGPYWTADAPTWLANWCAHLYDDENRLVINASKTTAMTTITKGTWFTNSCLDRHLVVQGGGGGDKVTEVKFYEVNKYFKVAQ